MLEVKRRDKCKQFIDDRYIVAFEAFWLSFELKMLDHSYTIIRLQFHIENQQYTTCHDGEALASDLDRNEKHIAG